MKSIDKRVHDLRRDVEGTFNRYGFNRADDAGAEQGRPDRKRAD